MWRSAVQLCAGLQRKLSADETFRTSETFQPSLGDHGGLAQLARAPALQAGGQRFESVILHCGFGMERTKVSDNPYTRQSGFDENRSGE